MKTEDRLLWPDYIKGICMLLIILCHTVNNLITAGVGKEYLGWKFANNLMYTFMVPAFFFISGFLAEKNIERNGCRVLALSSLRNILYPYVLWTFIQGVITIETGASNTKAHWSQLPWMFVDGYMQFWFFHALLIIFAADLLLHRLGAGALARFIVSYLLLMGTSLIQTVSWHWLLQLGENYIYFAAGGLAFRQNLCGIPRRSNALVLLFVSFMTLAGMVYYHAAYQTPLRPIGAFLGIVACWTLAELLCTAKRPLRWLQVTGMNSLSIYCLHLFFVGGIRWALIKFGFRNFGFHIAAGFTVGWVLPLIIARIDEKSLGILFRYPKRFFQKQAEKLPCEVS